MRKNGFWLFMVCFVVFSAFSCKKDKKEEEKDDDNDDVIASVEDLIIKDGEISGWQCTGTHWYANSSTDLNTYIDGEEPLYTSHGFVEAAHQKYTGMVLGNTALITLRVFDQGNSANAKDVYTLEKLPGLVSPAPWTGAGTEASIESLESQIIILYKSKYYVDLSIDHKTEEALNVLKSFAINISGKIK